MNDVFEFIETPYSLRTDLQFSSEDPDQKYGTESFSKWLQIYHLAVDPFRQKNCEKNW